MLSLVWLALAVPFTSPLPIGPVQDSAESTSASKRDDEPTRAPRFDFRNGFWCNLHHFLYRDALEQRAGRPLAIDDPDWSEAVAYYVEHMLARDLLFNEGMRAIDWTLSDAGSADELAPAGLDEEFAFVLRSAAPAYRRDAWPAHRETNAAWIESMRAPLAAHAAPIGARLSVLYHEPWPTEPIRVDVLAYANWAGGYTSDTPNHIRITTRYPRLLSPSESFEILIHEASHIVIRTVEEAIASAAQRAGLEPPRDLWHAVLFYTVGEVVRDSGATPDDYVPYAIANRVYDRRWTAERHALEQHWGAYLDGTIGLDAALDHVLASIAAAR